MCVWGRGEARYLSIFLLLCPNPRRVESAPSSVLNTWYYGVKDASDASKTEGVQEGLRASRLEGEEELLQLDFLF